jgi:hypothetical protein
VDVTADLHAPCAPSLLRPWVADLGHYPQWLTIVPRAVNDAPADGDGGPAWSIHLRARVGALSRSKRLRMVRTVDEADDIVFERRELDGQQHAAWILRAHLAPREASTVLTMQLHYGGRLWEPLVERLLRDEIDVSRQRLLTLLTDHHTSSDAT